MNNTSLLLDSSDNLGVALTDLAAGTPVELGPHRLVLGEFIAGKHKFSLQEFNSGDDLYLYGSIVGEATKKIPKGHAITLGNIKHKTTPYTRV